MMSAKKTTSSRLRHKMSLQQEVQTPDGLGGTTKSWQNVSDVWAEIIPIGGSGTGIGKNAGRELLFAGQVQSQISHRILLRYRDGVTAAMRLIFESRIFNIIYVTNSEEKRDKIEILAHEGVAT